MDEIKKIYAEEVRKYVNDNIINGLLIGFGEGVYNRNEKERRNLTLCSKLLANPELKAQIVEKIVNDGLNHALVNFKPTYDNDLKDKIFMRKIYDYLNVYQIVSLACYFDDQMTKENALSR